MMSRRADDQCRGLPSPQPSPASGRGGAPRLSDAARQDRVAPLIDGKEYLLPLAGEGGPKGRMRVRRAAEIAPAVGDLWVFGYGSLMWRPGFAFLERQNGLVRGWRRRLCVYSWVHRGTEAKPGLVLGLDRGGACHGAAFRVAAKDREATIAYLREREQVTSVYLEKYVRVLTWEGAMVTALTYVADRRHPQYAVALDREELLRLTATAKGRSGPNAEYILNTVAHLEEVGIEDATLEWLAARLRSSR